MGKGRPRKPTKLKVLHGNPGRRPLPESEPEPTVGAPEPPEWLEDEALAEWGRVVPELAAIGLVALVDRAALAAMCQSWADYVAAERAVGADGATVKTARGGIAKNPMVTVMNEAFGRWRVMAGQFGLTPSARASLAVPGKRGKEDLAGFTRHKTG